MKSHSSWTFLLDENMPKRTVAALRTMGYSAFRVIEVGLRAQPDTFVFAYARARNLIIITRDADFLEPQYSPPHAGILILSLPRVSGREIVSHLVTMLAQLQGQDLTNTLHQLTPSGIQRII